MKRQLPLWSILLSILLLQCRSMSPAASSGPLTISPIASNLRDPLFVAAPPRDSSRLLIVQQGGAIRIVKNGAFLPRPFLDCSGLVTTSGAEQGLLGLAFHPHYESNRYFYLDYTRAGDGATVISRFQTSPSDPDSAVLSSEVVLLTIPQPFANHNGGMLAFGPRDHYLYVGMGDGGSGGDPGNRAQDSTQLLGKILRLDVDQANGTLIPSSNPFVGRAGWRGEIWALGLRNPWRFSFDLDAGDLYVADVGQNLWEEIDYQSAGTPGGENYGWRLKEGTHCYNPATNCNRPGLTDPIFEYGHTSGRCSITGGYVYRGCAIPSLSGTYFFGDFCTGNVYSLVRSASGQIQVTDRTAELGTVGLSISSFGQDNAGEIYIVDLSGSVYKIVPRSGAAQCRVDPDTTADLDLRGTGFTGLTDLRYQRGRLTAVDTDLPVMMSSSKPGRGIDKNAFLQENE